MTTHTPPGLSAVAMRCSTPSGSGTKARTQRRKTRSKLAGESGTVSRRPSSSSMLAQPWRLASARTCSIQRGDSSSATTLPAAPTRARSSAVTKPGPQPASSTRARSGSATASSTSRVKPPQTSCWRPRRASSWSLVPRRYSLMGGEHASDPARTAVYPAHRPPGPPHRARASRRRGSARRPLLARRRRGRSALRLRPAADRPRRRAPLARGLRDAGAPGPLQRRRRAERARPRPRPAGAGARVPGRHRRLGGLQRALRGVDRRAPAGARGGARPGPALRPAPRDRGRGGAVGPGPRAYARCRATSLPGMYHIAIKMLFGDRLKYAGVVFGVAFTSFLVTFAASYFGGMMTRSFALIAENPEADVWVMDPAVRSVDQTANLPSSALDRVRNVAGVRAAVPLGLALADARLPNGRFQPFQVIGIDAASLAGVPALLDHAGPEVLRSPEGVIVDPGGSEGKLETPLRAADRWPLGAPHLAVPTRQLLAGD